jgi:hypothetical protein
MLIPDFTLVDLAVVERVDTPSPRYANRAP